MKDILFSRKAGYKSELTAEKIEEVLILLLKKDRDAPDTFVGKASSSGFILTPILGPRRGFKITMVGEVITGNFTRINVLFTISDVLKFVVYGMVLLYGAVFAICRIGIYNPVIGDMKHFDFLLFGTSLLFIIICKITFNYQYNYYSALIINLLAIEKIEQD